MVIWAETPRTGPSLSSNGRFSTRIVAFVEIGPWATGVGDHSPRAQGVVRNCVPPPPPKKKKKYIYYFKPPNGSMELLIQNYGLHWRELRKQNKYNVFETQVRTARGAPWAQALLALRIANFKMMIAGSIANCGAANSFIDCQSMPCQMWFICFFHSSINLFRSR